MLSEFKIRLVGSELVRWKRNLKEVFGVQGGTKSLVPLNRRAQVEMVFVEEKRPAPLLDDQVVREVDYMGPVNNPQLKIPEPKRGAFLSVEGKPYQVDSHMTTPPHSPRKMETSRS